MFLQAEAIAVRNYAAAAPERDCLPIELRKAGSAGNSPGDYPPHSWNRESGSIGIDVHRTLSDGWIIALKLC